MEHIERGLPSEPPPHYQDYLVIREAMICRGGTQAGCSTWWSGILSRHRRRGGDELGRDTPRGSYTQGAGAVMWCHAAVVSLLSTLNTLA